MEREIPYSRYFYVDGSNVIYLYEGYGSFQLCDISRKPV